MVKKNNPKEIHPQVKTHKCYECGTAVRVLEKTGITLKCKKCRGALFPLNIDEQNKAWNKI